MNAPPRAAVHLSLLLLFLAQACTETPTPLDARDFTAGDAAARRDTATRDGADADRAAPRDKGAAPGKLIAAPVKD